MDAVAELARKAGCKLTICPQNENHNDRWIQVPWPLDSILEGEAGASQAGVGGGHLRILRRTWGL